MPRDPAQAPTIVVTANGPYVVKGNVPLEVQSITPNPGGGVWTWTQGRSFEVKPVYALCRCGASATKPYCDGKHAKIAFDGTETASRAPFAAQAKTIEGPAMDLEDTVALCAFARFCDVEGGIWKLVAQTDTPAVATIVVNEASNCPSGRLVLHKRGSHEALEPDLPQSLALVEDPQKQCSGPIWVRGGIVVEAADGAPYEVRNRQTLCRCGASANKPFCDGAHADMSFDDGISP